MNNREAQRAIEESAAWADLHTLLAAISTAISATYTFKQACIALQWDTDPHDRTLKHLSLAACALAFEAKRIAATPKERKR